MEPTMLIFFGAGGSGTTSMALRTAWIAAERGVPTALALVRIGHAYSVDDLNLYLGDDAPIPEKLQRPTEPLDIAELIDARDSGHFGDAELVVVDAGAVGTVSRGIDAEYDRRNGALVEATNSGAHLVAVRGVSNPDFHGAKSFVQDYIDPAGIDKRKIAMVCTERGPFSMDQDLWERIPRHFHERFGIDALLTTQEDAFTMWTVNPHAPTEGYAFALDSEVADILHRSGVITSEVRDAIKNRAPERKIKPAKKTLREWFRRGDRRRTP